MEYLQAHVVDGGHWDFMVELGDTLADAGSLPLWQISWVYTDDPFDPTDDHGSGSFGTATPYPTGTPGAPTPTLPVPPTPLPTVTLEATPIQCPSPSISQQPPSAIVIDTFPPHPVVTGQGGRGFDVTAQAVSYPVIYRWWTREREYECKGWNSDVYGQPWGHKGHCCPDDKPDCDRDDYYRLPGDWTCVEHVRRIPDPILIDRFVGTADLRGTSIKWIETNLAGKYPGAHVKQAHWQVRATGSPVCDANAVCWVDAVVHFGWKDPGWYDLSVSGWTAGTQFTPPRSFGYAMPEPQPCYLIDTALIQ
jgi:hypothetical protein